MYGTNKNPYNSVRNININIDTPKKEKKIQYNILYNNIYNIIQNLKNKIIIIMWQMCVVFCRCGAYGLP